VASPPVRPAQVAGCVAGGPGEGGGEQAGDFVAGQRDETGRGRAAGVLESGGDGKERGGEHGQGDPPVPGCPAAGLVLVQAGQALAGLEVLLNQPLLMPLNP